MSSSKKIVLLFVLVLALAFQTATAGDYQDISFFFGTAADEWVQKGLSFSYGGSLGLNSFMELSLGATSELVPAPFSDNTMFLELSFALLGPVSTASRVAGVGINTLVSVGGFCGYDSGEGTLKAGPYLSLTPLAVGNPISGRRERALKTDIGYDFVNGKVYVLFSLLRIDFYVCGTYRDYF